jgi:hypothetical protein
MDFAESFKTKLFQINEENFEAHALEAYEFQFSQNPIYRSFCQNLKKTPKQIKSVIEIPFLPISFWKTHAVQSGKWNAEKVFLSSGTTQSNRSKGFVKHLSFYRQVFTEIFKGIYADIQSIEILALLPSYQDQGDSSLIYMIDELMSLAKAESSYYSLTDTKIIKTKLESTNHKKILFGVSYALLDLFEHQKIKSNNTTVIETGGMKGRKREITRMELHSRINAGIQPDVVHSEYGMSELMSQAYSTDNHAFRNANWLKVFIRDINDPFCLRADNHTGGINIIDLANIDTCCFIETQDLGKMTEKGTFQVLGRFDNSDIRGCNLLIH